jgi:hypothetical protein
MDFLDISSLGAAYRYVVKIEQKFKHQNKQEFGSANPQQPENGVSSTKALGTTPMNVAQNSHWWPRSKTKS